MKYTIKESQYGNIIDKFISYQLEPHEEKRTGESPESVFWVKDGEVIAEIEKSEYFWVSPRIWNNIMSMFSLGYVETQQVIKEWLEEHYKLGGLTPGMEVFYYQILLEEHYKLGGLTPLNNNFLFDSQLEEHYKLK